MGDEKLSRRQVLLTSGILMATGLAGCNGPQSGETTDSTATTGTATATPSDGSTETSGGETPTDCGQTTIDGNITTDTTFRGECTYTLSGGINVIEGATLTVEAGATIEAEGGSHLYVQNGAIVAQGTEANSIEFRGTSETPGHWDGIRVNTDDPANELTHITVSDGGGSTFKAANLIVGASGTGTSEARVTIRNCEFTNSAAAGVRVTSEGALDAFENNRLANNDGVPLDLHPRQFGSLDGSSTFENNGDSYIAGRWEALPTVETDATWPDPGIPYRMGVNATEWITLRASVDIEPGARFEFLESHGLWVASAGGELVANGESDNRIEFVGTEATPGHWYGIRINSEAANEITNVVVLHGGGTSFDLANVALGIDSTASATIHDCEISDSAGWGVIVAPGSSVDLFGTNFQNNAEGGIQRPDN